MDLCIYSRNNLILPNEVKNCCCCLHDLNLILCYTNELISATESV